jgi:Peptidase family S41
MPLNEEETMKSPILFVFVLAIMASCSVSKNYNPARKYAPEELQEDYHLFRNILEESHPSLYWYTPKDSVDYYFEAGAEKLKDSMAEYKFRYVLSYVLAKIRCGHTTVRASKEATRYSERTRSILFPINIKAWNDTVVVTSNLNRRDSALTRGAILKSIDGRPVETILDTMFQHLSADGYNTTHKYQTVSNTGVFRNMYGGIYGLRAKTPVEFIDTLGNFRSTTIGLYVPVMDSSRRYSGPPQPEPSKRERKKLMLDAMRNTRIDTNTNTAFMEVNTFSKGNKLRGYFKRSFKEIRKRGIENLVVDMRSNGGGSVTLSNLLTKYIVSKPFKIADSLYAISRKSRYKRYEGDYFLNRLFLIFMTHKREDGYYHFTYFEHKHFKPKSTNHFSGTTYILTGGNTFSAATLFTGALKDQEGVYVVGEETGGGSYGNTAWLIPDVTLPNTGVRFRLPLFRLVIDHNAPKGRGVMPDVPVPPTVAAIRHNSDFKMEKVMELIKEKSRQGRP